MRQDFFDYQPEFKLLVMGNNKPRLRSVDEAIRRRMNLIPFSVTIPDSERDPNLFEKLREEWPAILGWMVDGCLEWKNKGLSQPQSVLDATEDYLENEDKLGLWLGERCGLGRAESVGASACYRDWQSWCEEIGEHPGSQRAFAQELLSRPGIRNHRSSSGKSYIGLSLKSDRPADYRHE